MDPLEKLTEKQLQVMNIALLKEIRKSLLHVLYVLAGILGVLIGANVGPVLGLLAER